MLGSLGNTQPKIVPLTQYEYSQFRQQVMRLSGFDNSESEHFGNIQHLSVSEMICVRDILYTLIEAIKPYYKLV